MSQLQIEFLSGFSVSCYTWHRAHRTFVLLKSILFDNKESAEKCYKSMMEYQSMFHGDIFLKVEQQSEIYFVKHDLIHALSGKQFKLQEYESTKRRVEDIETDIDYKNKWVLMDNYADLFGLKPRRPRSCLTAFLCSITCLGCIYGCSSYEVN